jgi:hypothetical protein
MEGKGGARDVLDVSEKFGMFQFGEQQKRINDVGNDAFIVSHSKDECRYFVKLSKHDCRELYWESFKR